MQDILIDEKCPECGHNLTLMESQRVPEGTLWLVKRCLNCGQFPVEEVAPIVQKKEAKYLILKLEDVFKYLDMNTKATLQIIIDTISQARIADGKSTNNEYLVVNKDEKYIKEIEEVIMRREQEKLIEQSATEVSSE
jgi:hypothetical protein